MIKSKDICKFLDTSFNEYKENHTNHKKRVIKAIDWINFNIIEYSTNIIGSKVKSNGGIECMIISNDFRGVPYFNVSITIKPLKVSDNCGGSGSGSSHTINF